MLVRIKYIYIKISPDVKFIDSTLSDWHSHATQESDMKEQNLVPSSRFADGESNLNIPIFNGINDKVKRTQN